MRSSVPISYGGLSLVLNGIALLCHFRTSSGNFKENLQVLLGKQVIVIGLNITTDLGSSLFPSYSKTRTLF